MKELIIIDRIYKYKNTKYQHLLVAEATKIDVTRPLKTIKNKKKRKINASVSIKSININWKPDVLLILMGLMNKHFSSDKKFRVDDDI